LNSVDLPTPFLPTRPTFVPVGIDTFAESKKRRPQASKTRFSIRSMVGADVTVVAEANDGWEKAALS
jgi:hypothetical protein